MSAFGRGIRREVIWGTCNAINHSFFTRTGHHEFIASTLKISLFSLLLRININLLIKASIRIIINRIFINMGWTVRVDGTS